MSSSSIEIIVVDGLPSLWVLFGENVVESCQTIHDDLVLRNYSYLLTTEKLRNRIGDPSTVFTYVFVAATNLRVRSGQHRSWRRRVLFLIARFAMIRRRWRTRRCIRERRIHDVPRNTSFATFHQVQITQRVRCDTLFRIIC